MSISSLFRLVPRVLRVEGAAETAETADVRLVVFLVWRPFAVVFDMVEATEPVNDSAKESGISVCGAAFFGFRPFLAGALTGTDSTGSGTDSVNDCAGGSSRIEEFLGLRPLLAGGALGGIDISDAPNPLTIESATEAIVSSVPEAFLVLRPRFAGAGAAVDAKDAFVVSGIDATMESAIVSSGGAGSGFPVVFVAPFLARVAFFEIVLAFEDRVDARLLRAALGFCVCVGW